MKYNQVEPLIDNDDVKNVSEYLSSGAWITEHQKTRELENNIKDFVGRKYGIAVPNGTIAIYLSLLGLGLENKRIAVPNITMIATINAIIWANSTPVLIDVNSDDLCMSYDDLIKENDLDGVIFVPLNGRSGEGEKIHNWCKNNNIKFIEDSAHALGSSYGDTFCGSLGDASVISFTPHKIVTMGQGGMILTNHDDVNEKLEKLKSFNRSKDKVDWHEGFGLNFKITDMQAVLGLSQLEKLEKFIKNKQKNLLHYKNYINNENIEVMGFNDYEVPWFFDIKIESIEYKNIFIEKLRDNEIETRNVYPVLSKQSYLAEYSKNNLGVSENIFEKVIWLPSSNFLKEKDIKEISEVINSI
tara:strand:+ start:3 stop:1073 length:1071 start_codon:yes stop_codon:yes gene_type:complete